eukprot:CAMPEP_0198227292 /NCGR_PEP_ID=MMETSP1445-20131203/108663_1 /TAXON_ID=36898 /ORGANISM="Pyramimonas sp., Strain CCMP2087" /LENGTH=73 /DNA_ID=CAMNT_0043907311 /DNA_START=65 /DNA_END=283 /DNA_ORIENTATION=-
MAPRSSAVMQQRPLISRLGMTAFNSRRTSGSTDAAKSTIAWPRPTTFPVVLRLIWLVSWVGRVRLTLVTPTYS